MIPSIKIDTIFPELEFTTSRSSGPGGQNVNKVNSKVIVHWNVKQSQRITSEQKDWLLAKLANKLTVDGELILSSQQSRSQLENKELVLIKLGKILEACFRQSTPRKASKPTKTSKKKRLETKRKHSEKKQWRKRID